MRLHPSLPLALALALAWLVTPAAFAQDTGGDGDAAPEERAPEEVDTPAAPAERDEPADRTGDEDAPRPGPDDEATEEGGGDEVVESLLDEDLAPAAADDEEVVESLLDEDLAPAADDDEEVVESLLDEDLAPAAPPAPEREHADDVELSERGELVLRGKTIVLSAEDVFRSGGSVAKIDEEELERLGYRDPNNVVQRVPGVVVRVEDAFGLRPNIAIRGTNPERSRGITLMEDGILFGPAPYSAPAAYYFPLVSRMVGVDVYKGPSAILYGPFTTGGAIDFTSRSIPLRPGGQAELSYGSYGSYLARLHYGASYKRGGFLIEGLELGSKGYKAIDHNPRAPTGFSRREYVLKGFVQSRTTRRVYHRLDAKFVYSAERSHETYLGLTDADFQQRPDRRYVASLGDQMDTQRFAYSLRHRMEVGDELSLTTSLYRHDYQRLWHRFDGFGPGGPSAFEVLRSPNTSVNRVYYDLLTGAADSDPNVRSNRLVAANNDRTFVSQGAQSVLVYETERGALRHRLEAGVRVHYDEIRRDHTAESYLMLDRNLVRDESPLESAKDERAGALAIAAHAMYALEVGRFRITPGVRTELIRTVYDDYASGTSDTGFQHAVLGGLGANARLLPWLSAFAGFHRGFSPVAPGQRAEVDPEASLNFEAGFRALETERGLRAEVAGFVNDYSNLLLTCAGSGGCEPEDVGRQFNAGAVLVGGLEASLAYDLGLSEKLSMPIRGAYSLMKSRFMSSFTSGDPQYLDVERGDEVPYMPRQQGVFEAGLEHPRFGVRATATVVGHMREQAGSGGSGAFTDRYAIIDVMGEVRVTTGVALTLRVENLTNARPLVAHRPFGARPYRPLMAMGGLRVDL